MGNNEITDRYLNIKNFFQDASLARCKKKQHELNLPDQATSGSIRAY